jgi:hypothetical protein
MLSALGLGLLLPSLARSAAIEYGTAGSSYTQDFDSLGGTGAAWSNGTTITGWHWIGESGTTPSVYNATNASGANPNQVLSLGSNADRAFGGQNGNGIATLYYGAQILNSTGSTLGAFSLAYVGEQWRSIANESNDGLSFQYQIFDAGAGSLSAASGWTAFSALNFTAPTTSGSSTGLNGNDAANRASISSTVSGVSWSDGQEIWLRWADNNPANNSSASRRAAMGIDDLTFSATAVPEPSSAAILVGVSALALCALRRGHRADATAGG